MPDLRPYQEVSRDFLAARRHALLADGMRVGKTPAAIRAACKAGARTLLVTTPAIAVPQWMGEVERWWEGPLPRFQVWSYDHARAQWEAGRRGTVDVFIPDECHFAGNPTAARTGMVYGKTGFAYQAGATWALSGTPAPKSAASLWPMLKAFGVVGMAYEDFLRRYCILKPDSWIATGTKVEMIPELRALLAKCMLRRTLRDVAPDMPEIGFNFLRVQPTTAADLKIPAGLAEDQVLAWLEENHTRSREDRIDVAMAKAGPLAEEIIFAINNGLLKQTVVFGWHKEPMYHLQQLLHRAGLRVEIINGDTLQHQREAIMAGFRLSAIDVVLLNIATGGTAIDLSAADHGYMLEMDWVPGNNVQAVHRLVSMAKDTKVTIDVVTWAGSCDDWIQQVILTRVQQLAKLY